MLKQLDAHYPEQAIIRVVLDKDYPMSKSTFTTIALTGQSMIRGDARVDAPEAVPSIQSLLAAADIALTNFEAAVFDPAKGKTVRDGRFATPAQAVDALKSFGFNMLALPNNHSFDIGTDGIIATLEAAQRYGISHAGTGRDSVAADASAIVQTAKATVALVASASGLVKNGRATETKPGVNELGIIGAAPDARDAERILRRVHEAKKVATIVIASHHNHHYPGVELPADFKQLLLSQLSARLAPPEWLELWGRRLVDAGADVVAMHGPPFLHGMEIYKGKPIFYSLGNFIFQVPPESIHLEEPIMWESVVAYADFDADNLKTIRFQPIGMNKIGKGLPNPHDEFDVNEYHRTRGLPRPATGKQARFLLERFAELSKRYGTRLVIDGDRAELSLRSDPESDRSPPAEGTTT